MRGSWCWCEFGDEGCWIASGYGRLRVVDALMQFSILNTNRTSLERCSIL